MSLLERIDDFAAGADVLRRRRYGVIETRGGRLFGVWLRPWPKLISWPEVWFVPWRYHVRGQSDRCLVYYNQPLRCPNYLTLKYVASTHGTSYRTIREALSLLGQHSERHPQGLLAHEREGLSLLARCQSGGRASAQPAAERYLARAPRSPLAPRLRSACGIER